jgi:hypothetical protein
LRDNIEGFVQFTDSSIDFRIAKLKLDQKKDSNDLDWEEIKTLLKNADVNISSGDLASSLNKIKEFREFKQELKAALRLIESLPPNKVAKKKAEILEHMGNALARVDIIVKVCKKHTDEYMGQIDQIIKSISQPSQESNKQNSYQAQKSQSTETVQSQNSTNRSGSSASDKSTHGVPIPSGQPASR